MKGGRASLEAIAERMGKGAVALLGKSVKVIANKRSSLEKEGYVYV